jgi:hypothetical protein
MIDFPSRYLNPEPSRYKAVVLTDQPQRSKKKPMIRNRWERNRRHHKKEKEYGEDKKAQRYWRYVILLPAVLTKEHYTKCKRLGLKGYHYSSSMRQGIKRAWSKTDRYTLETENVDNGRDVENVFAWQSTATWVFWRHLSMICPLMSTINPSTKWHPAEMFDWGI